MKKKPYQKPKIIHTEKLDVSELISVIELKKHIMMINLKTMKEYNAKRL